MRLSELTLRVSPHKLVSLSRFDGLEVIARDLVPEAGPSWFLTGTLLTDVILLAFLLDEVAGEKALTAVLTSLAAGQSAVDLVRYTRPSSEGEEQAMAKEGDDAEVEGAGTAEGVPVRDPGLHEP